MSAEKSTQSLDKQVTPTEASHVEVRPIESPHNEKYDNHEATDLQTGDGVAYSTHSVSFLMTVVGCSFALCGSQIFPLLYLTLTTTVAKELNAQSLTIWLLTASYVAMGAVAPFIGPLADLIGRKSLFIIGLLVSVVGAIVCAVTPNAPGFIAGHILLGAGAVTQELLAIAVVSEIVPTSRRPLYAVISLSSIIPWSPGSLYANWMAQVSWRWIGCALALWNALTLIILMIFYRPPPRVNSLGLSRRELISRIDFIGGALLTIGLVFVLLALSWGGQQYAWTSAHVLSFLLLGFALMFVFVAWEFFGTKYPLFPRRIIKAPRPFFCMLFVIFAAGINYVPLVVFWPIEGISVFGADHHQNGLYTLPIGICILGGAILSAFLLHVFKKHITVVMTMFCVMQTVASASLTAIDPHNVATALPAICFALLGVGGVLVPNQVIITVITPPDLLASVTALTVALRAQTQVLGLAIFYNRFVAKVTEGGYALVAPAMIKAGVYDPEVIFNLVQGMSAVPYSALAKAIPQLMADPAAYQAVGEAALESFAAAFKLIYYITIAFGAPACVAAAFMGDVGQYMNENVAVKL
ncbi:hypothetical protein VC83_02808 [Pseudogymnoascus destructans]|uniref:Major facilitator superfamily (MFS) profile domain-containing protein n=2 Tax=Pseudogymnoascus destructans TaxID=655981 RepID=L8FWK6_PSED2|nr:uncharacterized protein VC83_02808 [Pseudogymnoascus destructans]ELR04919.1 hypothetical protein GMDG_00178 [Pseudogymnoascus destructans 20631-21]OAF60307.1 hypothetical protein VC83_02808 [Pseudogymnoascus destructans]